MTNANTGWTVETLLLHFTQLLQSYVDEMRIGFAEAAKARELALVASDKLHEATLEASKVAVSKAEASTERRFESVNEFRAQLADQVRTFLPKAEYDRAHEDLAHTMSINQRALSDKIDINQKALSDKIDILTTRMDRNEGHDKGISDTAKAIMGFVALVLTLLTIGGIVFGTVSGMH